MRKLTSAIDWLWPIVRVEHFARKLHVAESAEWLGGSFADTTPEGSLRPGAALRTIETKVCFILNSIISGNGRSDRKMDKRSLQSVG